MSEFLRLSPNIVMSAFLVCCKWTLIQVDDDDDDDDVTLRSSEEKKRLRIKPRSAEKEIIPCRHFEPVRDDQAELAWVAWLNTKTVCPQMVTQLSTKPAQYRYVTWLMCPTTLPLSQIAIYLSA